MILVEFEPRFKFLYEKKVFDEGLYSRSKIWEGRQPSTGLRDVEAAIIGMTMDVYSRPENANGSRDELPFEHP